MMLAKGLMERYNLNCNYALDIIIAENIRNADTYFSKGLKDLLPDFYPLDKLVGLVESSVGKMVPIMQTEDVEKDMLQIIAEPYNTLIVGKTMFKTPVPDIEGLAPKQNINAWVDRKSFIHNLGHSAAAYIGYLYNPLFIFMYEALAVPEVYYRVRAVMLQSAGILMRKYPDEFSIENLNGHIDDLLLHFQNRTLGDTIYRCGCDLTRKLSAGDRIAGAIKLALELGLPYDNILYALVCGCHFRAKGENGQMMESDIEFIKLYEKGLESVLTEVCGFDERQDIKLFGEAENMDKYLKGV